MPKDDGIVGGEQAEAVRENMDILDARPRGDDVREEFRKSGHLVENEDGTFDLTLTSEKDKRKWVEMQQQAREREVNRGAKVMAKHEKVDVVTKDGRRVKVYASNEDQLGRRGVLGRKRTYFFGK